MRLKIEKQKLWMRDKGNGWQRKRVGNREKG